MLFIDVSDACCRVSTTKALKLCAKGGGMFEHQTRGSERYRQVENFIKLCISLSRELRELGIGIATSDVTPNYVLMEDKWYRRVREAWEKLLRREDAKDELWKWQAETWTDFSVLLLVLSIFEMPDTELIAQSPILFNDEAVKGVWYKQDRPIAVFWLKSINRVVEVMARPDRPGTLMYLSRAHVALRVSDPSDPSAYPHRVAVWTPHSLRKLDLLGASEGAFRRLYDLQRLPSQTERIKHGLILTPAHGEAQTEDIEQSGLLVHAISLDGSGAPLANGRRAIRAFLTRDIWG